METLPQNVITLNNLSVRGQSLDRMPSRPTPQGGMKRDDILIFLLTKEMAPSLILPRNAHCSLVFQEIDSCSFDGIKTLVEGWIVIHKIS